MAVSVGLAEPMSEISRRQLRRALVAATVGTTIDWYDFILYNTAASLYLGKLFFPSFNPFVGTLAAFGTYFVGFIVRPVGALFFGHLGDRVGRKATLVATLILMGLATFLIGLTPTYAQIGVWGAVILTVLRVLQGIAASGEWGGAVLLTVEWGPRGRRGWLGAWPQLGIPAGVVLGQVGLQLSALWLGQDSYWAWRLPFLASILLLFVGLYIRLSILETPVFTRLVEERRLSTRPSLDVLRQNLGQVVLAGMVKLGQAGPNTLFITFILVYATAVLKIPQREILNYVLIGQALSLVTTLMFGSLSDRVGRKPLYIAGSVLTLLWAIPYWQLLSTKVTVLMIVAIILGNLFHDMMNGPQGALMTEQFTGSRRYSGSSISYHIGALSAGAQILAVYLLQRFHSIMPVAFIVMACALLSLIGVILLKDRSDRDLSLEYDD